MIVVVIPCYKVTPHIAQVINGIGDEVGKILVIDDKCPDESGKLVMDTVDDPRVEVIFRSENGGVGAAVKTGYKRAIALDADVVVKLDGDGQMDPALIPSFVSPILRGEADYTKGNRFFEVDVVNRMPVVRLLGNAILSFMTKLSSGYWNIFDPTNGYTAISGKLLSYLLLDKIANRYFFESDMLFRLNTIRAVVVDIPMNAIYGDEKSNLSVSHAIPVFLKNNLKNFGKRMFYNYFIRDFNYASIQLLAGSILTLFGFIYGGTNWVSHVQQGTLASAGTVMIAGLTFIVGVQMLLGFLQFDMTNVPTNPLQKSILKRNERIRPELL